MDELKHIATFGASDGSMLAEICECGTQHRVSIKRWNGEVYVETASGRRKTYQEAESLVRWVGRVTGKEFKRFEDE